MKESYEVLKEAVESVGVKQVALEMKMSHSLVYKWCQEPKSEAGDDASGARNPLDRVAALYTATQQEDVIDWLCEIGGGVFVREPKVAFEKIDAECLNKTQSMILEFSQLLQTISKSIADDGVIDKDEAKSIRLKWRKLKRNAEEFTYACEKGFFNKE